VEDNGGRQASLDDCEERRAQVEESNDGEISEDDLAAMLDTVEMTGMGKRWATVTYTDGAEAGGDSDPVTVEVTLTMEDGVWKVDDSGPALSDVPDDSPQAAARDHAQAILDGDCETFLAVLTDDALAQLGATADDRSTQCERRMRSGVSPVDPRLGLVFDDSVDDDSAVVGVTIFSESYDGGNNVFYVAVAKEDGVWKVDQLGWDDFPEDTAD